MNVVILTSYYDLLHHLDKVLVDDEPKKTHWSETLCINFKPQHLCF